MKQYYSIKFVKNIVIMNMYMMMMMMIASHSSTGADPVESGRGQSWMHQPYLSPPNYISTILEKTLPRPKILKLLWLRTRSNRNKYRMSPDIKARIAL